MKKLMAVFGLVIFTAGLAGCNTFRGMGQDVEKGGEKMQSEATKHQN